MNKVELKFDTGEVTIEVVYDYEKKNPFVNLTVCNNAWSGTLIRLTSDEARKVGDALYMAAMEAEKK